MVEAIRREAIAWILAGFALHLMIKEGFNKWSMTALGMSLGISASTKIKRKPKMIPPIEPD
jgi:hypothetical protein